MTEFHVREAALFQAAVKLEALASQAGPARSYASSHLTMYLTDTGSLGVLLTSTLDTISHQVPDLIERVQTHLLAAAAEIEQPAVLYKQTDDAVDAALDTTY